MSIPKDGYYIALVQCDTGGEVARWVQVSNGVPYTSLGDQLKPEACSDFSNLPTWAFCSGWPGQAAEELEALRTANAGLVEKVAELQSWKDQQMQVESEWRPNDLAALLGGGLGEPQRVVIQREALKLVESIKDRERERDHANAVADALVRENAELRERVTRLEDGGSLALGYCAKGDLESADEVWSRAKGQP